MVCFCVCKTFMICSPHYHTVHNAMFVLRVSRTQQTYSNFFNIQLIIISILYMAWICRILYVLMTSNINYIDIWHFFFMLVCLLHFLIQVYETANCAQEIATMMRKYIDSVPFLASFSDIEFNAVPQLLSLLLPTSTDEGSHSINTYRFNMNESQLPQFSTEKNNKLTHIQLLLLSSSLRVTVVFMC